MLQEMLHVGPSKLRRFIAEGSLRVRDPRISAKSLVALRDDRIAAGTVATEAVEGVPQKLRKNRNGYSWGSAAKLLGIDVGQVREWIVEGKLKIVDGFVTERAFQDFCKHGGSELNSALLGNEVRDWLVEGYSLPVDAEAGASSIPGNQKHALVTRRCPGCRRPMRGNVYFRHIKQCNKNPSPTTLAAANASIALLDLPYPSAKLKIEAVWHQRADHDRGLQWLLNEVVESIRELE